MTPPTPPSSPPRTTHTASETHLATVQAFLVTITTLHTELSHITTFGAREEALIERSTTDDARLQEIMTIRDVHALAMTAVQKGRLDAMVAQLDTLFAEIDGMAARLHAMLDAM